MRPASDRNPASTRFSIAAETSPPFAIFRASATSVAVFAPSTNVLSTRAENFGCSVMTSLNMSSKSSRNTPFGAKQSRRTFSNAESDGEISSRYLGTPPVTESTSMISRESIRAAFLPQNFMLTSGGSSRTTMSSDRRPTYARFSTISSRIQLETLPQRTSTSRGCFLNRSSQAFFRISGKVNEYWAIHEISSMRTTVRPSSRSSWSRRMKAEYQSEGGVFSHPVCAASFDAKKASWSASVMPGFGRRPSSLTNRAPERRANSSISVDLPIRRRPRHVTSEEPRFAQRASSCSNSPSRPKKSPLRAFMRHSIPKRTHRRQPEIRTYFAFCSLGEDFPARKNPHLFCILQFR